MLKSCNHELWQCFKPVCASVCENVFMCERVPNRREDMWCNIKDTQTDGCQEEEKKKDLIQYSDEYS